ncbi:MAG: hypothetical protein QOG53_3675 [Frankiales bacterium]|nr:hypothetical protein [Frankiales bacterium]
MPRFRISASESVVVVGARTSLHPFAGAGPVSGHFEAELNGGGIDLTRPSGGIVRVDVKDLHSEAVHLDREMLRRLQADRYPLITGVLRAITEVTHGRYLMEGELTLHGRTCSVEGEAAVNVQGDGRLHFDGVMELDIREFGIDPPKLLILKVDPVLEVGLTFVADADTSD